MAEKNRMISKNMWGEKQEAPIYNKLGYTLSKANFYNYLECLRYEDYSDFLKQFIYWNSYTDDLPISKFSYYQKIDQLGRLYYEEIHSGKLEK